MKKTRNASKMKRKILDATHLVLNQGGFFTKFKLDTVAETADVSKGGLMHHFPTKESLLIAAAEDAVEQFEQRLNEELKTCSGKAGDFTRAYINVIFADHNFPTAEFSPVILNYLRLSSSLESETSFERRDKQTREDGIDAATAAIIRLAVDGLIFTEMIDQKRIDPENREKIKQRLLELVEE